MTRLAFLSTRDLVGFVCDDDLAVPAFASNGVQVQTLPWQEPAEWAAFDAVLIRSTWDYQRHPEAFLKALEQISAQTRLFNPLPVVQWNLHKRYLLELQAKEVPIVPTRLSRGLRSDQVERWREEWQATELVAKPAIGANADDAFRLPVGQDPAELDRICARFEGRELLVQPFLPSIESEGEFSLFFFAGALSHTIQKVPKSGDFRVQEEHGGDIRPLPCPAMDLIEAAHRALAALNEELLYARVDLVRDAEGQPRLMELELIEPALYLRTDPGAADRFAAATLARL